MEKDVNKLTVEAIQNVLLLEGTSIEFTLGAIKEVKKYGFLRDLKKQAGEGMIRVFQDDSSIDKILFLDVLSDMLENGEIKLTYTDKATERNINYINKLIEE